MHPFLGHFENTDLFVTVVRAIYKTESSIRLRERDHGRGRSRQGAS
jgi:hypothetical protein